MIKDLDELAKFLKLCRKQGVTEIRFAGCHVGFGDLPVRKSGQEVETDTEIDSPDELTPEQLMYFSAGGQPP